MQQTESQPAASTVALDTEFKRGLGLFSGTMIVAGSMIGSGIFIVSADMARLIGSAGWLLVAWAITGVLTLAAALSYGELAALMPRAGGQYVFLRDSLSPIWGFLYGWTFILVIQAGTIAAVAVAFARFGSFSESEYLISPIRILPGYAISLSKAQLVAIGMIVVLTITNMRGIDYGKWIQNLFTVAKTGALLIMIVLGLTLGWNSEAVSSNFGNFWAVRTPQPIVEGLSALSAFGLFAALCVAQTGSLFSADAWHNVATVAGEVREPRRNIPLALALGAGGVIVLYMLANVAYLVSLPLDAIQNAPADRVATAMINRIFPGVGVIAMSAAIMISTFGCNNGLILVGARVSYAMARDGLFFRKVGTLNSARVPGWGLALQGVWAAALVLPRTIKPDGTYGNLYGNLLDYVISAALIFYILAIIGLFRLRKTRPDAERPYQAFGYPLVPGFYILGAAAIVVILFMYRPMTTWPGLLIVLLGLPLYYFITRSRSLNS
ncbi:MAG TPA: amino acid permease [Verrucomicrobiae bacterium]|nr:amino acid permease [Verrucomicrobiae bacterium]